MSCHTCFGAASMGLRVCACQSCQVCEARLCVCVCVLARVRARAYAGHRVEPYEAQGLPERACACQQQVLRPPHPRAAAADEGGGEPPFRFRPCDLSLFLISSCMSSSLGDNALEGESDLLQGLLRQTKEQEALIREVVN